MPSATVPLTRHPFLIQSELEPVVILGCAKQQFHGYCDPVGDGTTTSVCPHGRARESGRCSQAGERMHDGLTADGGCAV